MPPIMLSQTATFKLGQIVHKGRIGHQHETELSKFYVKFDSRRLGNRWVDLELPGPVKNGEFGFWRLSGYDTWDEGASGTNSYDEDGDPNSDDNSI